MGDLHTRTHQLQDDKTQYFVRTKAGALCFRRGTEVATPKEYAAKLGEAVANEAVEGSRAGAAVQRKPLELQQQPSMAPKTKARSRGNGKRLVKCVCRPGWHGPYCGVPTMVYHSNLPTKERLTPRENPRRVINAINVNHEFDLLHVRFHELAEAVDLFLVCESNFTAFGEKRPLRYDTIFASIDLFTCNACAHYKRDAFVVEFYLSKLRSRPLCCSLANSYSGCKKLHMLVNLQVFKIQA